MNKLARGIIITVQTFGRTDPKTTLTITEHAGNIVIPKCFRMILLVKEGRETIAVETVQSVFRTYPDITVLILTDLIDKTAGKPL